MIGGLALVLGLSPSLGCVVAPLDPDTDAEITAAEVDGEPGSEAPGEDADGDDLQPGPDPIPWKPSSFSAGARDDVSPGAPVLGPDPIPWRPIRSEAESDPQAERAASAP